MLCGPSFGSEGGCDDSCDCLPDIDGSDHCALRSSQAPFFVGSLTKCSKDAACLSPNEFCSSNDNGVTGVCITSAGCTSRFVPPVLCDPAQLGHSGGCSSNCVCEIATDTTARCALNSGGSFVGSAMKCSNDFDCTETAPDEFCLGGSDNPLCISSAGCTTTYGVPVFCTLGSIEGACHAGGCNCYTDIDNTGRCTQTDAQGLPAGSRAPCIRDKDCIPSEFCAGAGVCLSFLNC